MTLGSDLESLETVPFHIGIKSLPKGSLPTLIGTIRGH